MANKRYYWLKLKDDFFRNKQIKKLRKIAGGDTYVIIYLKMQLESLKTGGCLYYDGVEDDFCSELALDLDEDVENVKMTVLFLMKHDLLEQREADSYFMTEVPNVTGSESYSAERVRKHRALQCNNKALQCNSDVTACNEEKEIEKRDKIKENRYGDENVPQPKKKPTKKFKKPTLEEVQAYCLERKNNVDAEKFIDYYESNGWRVGKNPMKDWKASVRTWERNNYGGYKNGTNYENTPDYSNEEGLI